MVTNKKLKKMTNYFFEQIRKIAKYCIGKGYTKTSLGNFLYKRVFPILKPTLVKLKGYKLYIYKNRDVLSDYLTITHLWEPLETKLINQQIKEGDVVIDIGAHIGYYTILFSKLVGRKGKVYAFEPISDNFALLQKNIKLNLCKNVIAIQKAALNKNGRVKMYLNEGCSRGSYHIFNKDNKKIEKFRKVNKKIEKTFEVEGIKLDSYFKNRNISKIDFIKIDVEDAEILAFKGASNILKQTNKIMLEFISSFEKTEEEIKELLNLFINQGFSINRINQTSGKIEKITLSRVLRENPNKHFKTLFCIKNEN